MWDVPAILNYQNICMHYSNYAIVRLKEQSVLRNSCYAIKLIGEGNRNRDPITLDVLYMVSPSPEVSLLWKLENRKF